MLLGGGFVQLIGPKVIADGMAVTEIAVVVHDCVLVVEETVICAP